MNKELLKRLSDIPEIEPDTLDKESIQRIQATKDKTTMSQEQLERDILSQYSGKILVRIPKSLHATLSERAAIEGVSLNQYIVYKLTQ